MSCIDVWFEEVESFHMVLVFCVAGWHSRVSLISHSSNMILFPVIFFRFCKLIWNGLYNIMVACCMYIAWSLLEHWDTLNIYLCVLTYLYPVMLVHIYSMMCLTIHTFTKLLSSILLIRFGIWKLLRRVVIKHYHGLGTLLKTEVCTCTTEGYIL